MSAREMLALVLMLITQQHRPQWVVIYLLAIRPLGIPLVNSVTSQLDDHRAPSMYLSGGQLAMGLPTILRPFKLQLTRLRELRLLRQIPVNLGQLFIFQQEDMQ